MDIHTYNIINNNTKFKDQLEVEFVTTSRYMCIYTRGGADKCLARPGRKRATATKLGIYATYFPRSSIHFLAHCFNFCKPLKKFRTLSVQPGLRGSNDLRVGRKMATFQLVFSPGNRW